MLHHSVDLAEDEFVDHDDTNKLNNKPHNLRISDRSENGCNRTNNKNNKLGLKNIYASKNGKYVVQIRKEGKRFVQSNINTLEDAIIITQSTRDSLHLNFARN